MPIEFNCSTCGQFLRVADEHAGKKARCPKCQTISHVPAGYPPEPVQPADHFDKPPGPPDHPPPPDPYAGGVNPYAAPMRQTYRPQERRSIGDAKVVPTAVDAGDVLSMAWDIWKRHLGLLVGITVVIFGVNFLFNFGGGFIQGVFEENNNPEAALFVAFGTSIFGSLIQLFLNIGQAQITLKLARNRSADFGDLFGGGAIFFPVLGASILFGLAVGVGFLLCIIPGIIVGLLFWPFFLLIIDGKADVMESFSVAFEIGKVNAGTTFMLWLASIGIWLVGILAFCVGLIFAAPLITMVWTCAYLMMARQLPKQRR